MGGIVAVWSVCRQEGLLTNGCCSSSKCNKRTAHRPTDNKHQAPCPPIYLPTARVGSNSEVRLGPTNVPAAEPPKVLKVHIKAASLSNAFHLTKNALKANLWINSAKNTHLLGNVLLCGASHIYVVAIRGGIVAADGLPESSAQVGAGPVYQQRMEEHSVTLFHVQRHSLEFLFPADPVVHPVHCPVVGVVVL